MRNTFASEIVSWKLQTQSNCMTSSEWSNLNTVPSKIIQAQTFANTFTLSNLIEPVAGFILISFWIIKTKHWYFTTTSTTSKGLNTDLQYYLTTFLLIYSTTWLPAYWSTVLQYYLTTYLLIYSTTWLPAYWTTVLLDYLPTDIQCYLTTCLLIYSTTWLPFYWYTVLLDYLPTDLKYYLTTCLLNSLISRILDFCNIRLLD